MKSKIIYVILAIVLALSLAACGSGISNSETNDSETISSKNSKSPTDLAAVNKAYNDILNQYGITPHSSDDRNSNDYSIEDIIGDSTPELIIYGDSFEIRDDSYRNSKDIYGYDNNKGDTFQYKGETQIVEPHKGKDNYCIGGTHSEGSLLYSIYEASGRLIKLVQKINHDISSPDSSGLLYTIGDKAVSKEEFKNELSKYVDVSSFPEDAIGAEVQVASPDDGTESTYNGAISETKSITLDNIKLTLEKNCIFEGSEILQSGDFKGTAKFYIQAVCPYCDTALDDVIEQSSAALRGMMRGWGIMSLPLNDKVKCHVCGAEYTYYFEAEIIP